MVVVNDKKDQIVTSEKQLRKIIPKYPKMLDKRLLPRLDQYCMEIIEASTLAVLAVSNENIPMAICAAEDVFVENSTTLRLAHQRNTQANAETNASLYFLVPGVGHGLRVNGQVRINKEAHQSTENLTFSIRHAYLHCSRAAVRAKLWEQSSYLRLDEESELPTPKDFLSKSPYLLLKTINQRGETEISPRGDQKGFIHWINDNSLFLPERPGNKVAISLRNIMENECVEILMFVPGTHLVMHINGKGSVTSDAKLLDATMNQNKRPKLGILITDCQFRLSHNKNLAQASPWLASTHITADRLTKFSKALSIHMNGEGIMGKATTPVVDAIVKHDLKHLY